MKKLACLLAAALVLVALVLPVSAEPADGTMSVTASAESVKQGEEFTVAVALATNPGLISFKFNVEYDTTKLELTKATDTEILNKWVTPSKTITSPYTLFWKDGLAEENNPATGTIVNLTFTAKSDAAVGATTIAATFLQANGVDAELNQVKLTFEGASTSVTIACATHSFGDWTETTPATCEAKGVKTRTCSACSTTETEEIPALGHDWGEGVVTTPATCEAKGVKTFTCKNDSTHTKTEEIPALGHDWDEGTVVTPATCTTAGSKTFKCKTDSTHTKTEEIPATGHTPGEATIIENATLTTEGKKETKCTVCGEVISTEVIPTLVAQAKEETGVAVEVKDDTFAADVILTVVKETGNEAFETAKKAVEKIGKDVTVFEITATLGGEAVQPTAPVKVSFPIPEGYGKNVVVVYIAADGTTEELASKVSEDGKTVEVELTHFSTYAVVKRATRASDTGDSTTLLLAATGIMVLCAVGVLGTTISLRKKEEER